SAEFRERLHDRHHRVLHAVDSAGHPRAERAQHAGDDCQEDLLLVGEVLVEQPHAHSGGAGDRLHGDGVRPLLLHEVDRRVDDLPAPQLRACALHGRGHVRSTDAHVVLPPAVRVSGSVSHSPVRDVTSSRILNFWIFPLGVRGNSSRMRSSSGQYCFATPLLSRNSFIPSNVSSWPALSVTAAHAISCSRGCGTPTTATVSIAGCS